MATLSEVGLVGRCHESCWISLEWILNSIPSPCYSNQLVKVPVRSTMARSTLGFTNSCRTIRSLHLFIFNYFLMKFTWLYICKSGRCSTVLRRGGTLWNAWNTCPIPEQCGMVWNGMEWVCLDNTCHPLSPPVNPRNGKILNWS